MDQIHQGIYLQIDQTDKFKTINFTINFLEPLQKANISKRALLAAILENSNNTEKTPDQIAVHLENLYGANFSLSHYVEGQTSILSLSAICPAPQFLPAHEDVFHALVALIKKNLFQPAQEAGVAAFDQAIFNREQTNLKHKVQSYLDDKQYAAALATKSLYFGADNPVALPTTGRLVDIEAISAANLWAYFEQLLVQNQVVITVTGDVAALDIEGTFDWPELRPRPKQTELPLFYQQPLKPEVNQGQQQLSVTQGKLNLMYQVPVTYYGPQYFDYLVANTVFGGSAQSMLFMNVREKLSLAYYANSNLDAFTGTIMVQTGIDSDKKDVVLAEIDNQLARIQKGDIDDVLIANAKKLLIDQFAQRSDSPFGRNLRYLFQFLQPAVVMDTPAFATAVNGVTKAAIQAAASNFKLQTIYAIEKRYEDATD
ncbi:MAG: insulinase family protein [Lactobacillus sp.]|jgi:predicted Zn-dependent peptidase|nr:insulinase family protein [Lactobacillus sp.]